MRNTRTGKNLLAAYAGECQASVRYAAFAKAARKEGYEQVAAVFLETSGQEQAHASRMRKLMRGLEEEVCLTLRSPDVGTTLENLRRAAGGEARVGTETYPAYAATAREEGFAEAGVVFENIAVAERLHMARYQRLADLLEAGQAFRRDEPVLWFCRHCGWAREGLAAPERCPACAHPQAHFEVARPYP